MSKKHIAGTMVKLTPEEIGQLVKDHIALVKVFAHKFDKNYLSIDVQMKDYREFLDSMDESLKRAEKLMEILGAGGKE